MSNVEIEPVVVIGLNPGQYKPESEHSLFVFLTKEEALEPNNWPKNSKEVFISGTVPQGEDRKTIYNYARNELGASVHGTQTAQDFKLTMQKLIQKAGPAGNNGGSGSGNNQGASAGGNGSNGGAGGSDKGASGAAGGSGSGNGGGQGGGDDPHIPKLNDPKPASLRALVEKWARFDTLNPTAEAQRLLVIAEFYQVPGKLSSIKQLIFTLRKSARDSAGKAKDKKSEKKKRLSLRLGEILTGLSGLVEQLHGILPEIEQLEAEGDEAAKIRAENITLNRRLEKIKRI